MGHLLQAFQALLTPLPMFYVSIGVILGCTVGAIPGLTGSMLIALTLPLTYYMSSVNAITLLVSMYVGAISGGLITATIFTVYVVPIFYTLIDDLRNWFVTKLTHPKITPSS